MVCCAGYNPPYKADLGALTYDRSRNAGPHAITQVGTTLYGYDAYGNMTTRGTATVQYNVFNKPTAIGSSTFSYGPNHQLIKSSNNGVTSYLFGTNYREETQSGQLTEKITLPGIAVLARNNNVVTTTYLHGDALGSVEAMTDKLGQNTTRLSFDVWGKRQKSDWTTGSPGSSFATSTGFTGHEMLDPSGLIHMGGRVYDANIGRFMSADILVQDPSDSQSFNRYSYVGNRPLSMVDPTGYCGGNILPDGKSIVTPCPSWDFNVFPGGGMSGPTPWDLYMAAGAVVANAWEPVSQFVEGTFDQSLEDMQDQAWESPPSALFPYASPTWQSNAQLFGPRSSSLGDPKSKAEENGRKYGSMLLPLVTKSPGGAAKKLEFATEKQLKQHWKKHNAEWGGISQEQYAARANRFLGKDLDSKMLEYVRPDGSKVRYSTRTGEFGVLNADGYIATLFRPAMSKRGGDGLDYFLNDRLIFSGF